MIFFYTNWTATDIWYTTQL